MDQRLQVRRPASAPWARKKGAAAAAAPQHASREPAARRAIPRLRPAHIACCRPTRGSDSEPESGGLSSVPTDRSEEQQMELDVQTFQLEEVAAMDVRTGDSSSTTRMPRVDVDPRRAHDGPMHQAAV